MKRDSYHLAKVPYLGERKAGVKEVKGRRTEMKGRPQDTNLLKTKEWRRGQGEEDEGR